MSAVDLKVVAAAIRRGRFEEVSPEVWSKVADMVEDLAPKKRGRPAIPKNLPPLEKYCECIERKSKSKVITVTDRAEDIFTALRAQFEQGAKTGEAINQVSEDLGISEESIEALLTSMKAAVQIEMEMEQDLMERMRRCEDMTEEERNLMEQEAHIYD